MAITYHAGRRIQGLALTESDTTLDSTSGNNGWSTVYSSNGSTMTHYGGEHFTATKWRNLELKTFVIKYGKSSASSTGSHYLKVYGSDHTTQIGSTITGTPNVSSTATEGAGGTDVTFDLTGITSPNTEWFIGCGTSATGGAPTNIRINTSSAGDGSNYWKEYNGYTDYTSQSASFTLGYVDVSGDTKPTNVQLGSRFEETDTRKIYHFEEGQDTEENIFNSAFTMTGNAAQTTSTDPTGKIVLTQSGGSGNQANAYRTLSSISSSNKTFTADFTFKRNTGDLANSNYVRFASVNTFTSGITGNAKRFYFSFENAGYIRVATETASDTSNTFTDGTDMQAANTTKYYRFVGNGSTLVLTMYPTLSDRTNGTNADRTYQSVNFPSDWTTTDPIDTFELLGASGYHTGNWEVSDVEMSFNSANAWKEEGT